MAKTIKSITADQARGATAGLNRDEIAQQSQLTLSGQYPVERRPSIPKADLQSFQAANPGLQFTNEDYTRYQMAGMPQVEPSITAKQIINPNPLVQPPVPKVSTTPSQFVSNLTPTINQSSQGLIQAQTKEAEQRNDVLNRLLSTPNESTQTIYDNAFKNNKGDEYLQQFTDANTKLAQLQGKFNTAKAGASGSVGQSQVSEGLELNELSRFEAVEVGNQALVVQAMQGNVETARQIALDTTKFATEDRMFKLDNLSRQFDALNGIVTGQEAQLLEKEKQRVEAEKAELKRLQDTIDSAITSGGATTDDMIKLTDPSLSDEEKLSFAQSIVARTATSDKQFKNKITLEELSLDREQFAFEKEKFIANYNLDLDKFNFDQQLALIENESNQDKPLTTEELLKFGGLPAGTTWKDVIGMSPEKPVTESQKSAAGFASRIQDANSVFENLEGYVNGMNSSGFWMARKLPNFLKDGRMQQLEQAERNFINAILRKESGAAIAESEFNNARQQYFPQPGDRPEVLAQKKAARQRALENIANEAGSAWGGNKKSLFDLEGAVQGNVNERGGLVQRFSSRFKQGSIGGQCGTFAHKLVNFPSVGDPIEQKFASVRKYGTLASNWAKSPRVGDVIITNENKTYGHVAVVNKILPNGQVQLSESNYAKPNMVTHNRVIAINSPRIYGAIRGTPIL